MAFDVDQLQSSDHVPKVFFAICISLLIKSLGKYFFAVHWGKQLETLSNAYRSLKEGLER